jgi:hypothetical protein
VQARLDLGDGLGGAGEQDSAGAEVAGGLDVGLYVVKEDHLAGRYAEPRAGQFVDALVRLADPDLVRVDDVVGQLFEGKPK